MYVVKRSFKNLGIVHTPGSVITDPSCIKRFKGKLAEGKIIEVTEQTHAQIASYFKTKFGVDIPELVESPKSKEVSKEVSSKAESVKKVVVASTKVASK